MGVLCSFSHIIFFPFYSNRHLNSQNMDFWGLPLLAVKWWSKETNRLTAKKDRCTVTIIHSQSTSRQYWPVHLTLLGCLYENVPFEQESSIFKRFCFQLPTIWSKSTSQPLLSKDERPSSTSKRHIVSESGCNPWPSLTLPYVGLH